jgi:hypothetical protein
MDIPPNLMPKLPGLGVIAFPDVGVMGASRLGGSVTKRQYATCKVHAHEN